jgi:LacI family transcriptional regulator
MSGVAPSTVSAVLTGKTERVKASTRERIIEVMRELRYVPSPMFYGNKGQTLTTLGVVVNASLDEVSEELDEYYLSIVSGISAVALRSGCNVMLVPTHSWESATKALRVYVDGRCDALLLLNPAGCEEIISALKERNYPYVLVSSEIEDPTNNYVGIDLYHGATIAMDYLVSLGHTRIAYLAGNWSKGRPRDEAYLNALTSRNLPVRAEWMPEGDYRSESGFARTLAMMTSNGEKPTAIFCESDPIAFGVLKALAELNIDVPGEVSVIGFDDVRGAALTQPPLTTIRRPLPEIGAAAAKMVIGQLEHVGKCPERIEFNAELVKRGTTGPAIK